MEIIRDWHFGRGSLLFAPACATRYKSNLQRLVAFRAGRRSEHRHHRHRADLGPHLRRHRAAAVAGNALSDRQRRPGAAGQRAQRLLVGTGHQNANMMSTDTDIYGDVVPVARQQWQFQRRHAAGARVRDGRRVGKKSRPLRFPHSNDNGRPGLVQRGQCRQPAEHFRLKQHRLPKHLGNDWIEGYCRGELLRGNTEDRVSGPLSGHRPKVGRERVRVRAA